MKVSTTTILNSTNHFSLRQKKIISNSVQKFYFFKNSLPLRVAPKKFFNKFSTKSGRNNTGRVVVRTKKSILVNQRNPKVNHSFRLLNLFFVANVIIIPKLNKLYSLTILSSGGVTYLPTTYAHELFTLSRAESLLSKSWILSSQDNLRAALLSFKKVNFLILQLPKNKAISLLEPLPGRGIIFTRSPGSSASILKMNSISGAALVKLSSGVKKVFSIYSLGSAGGVTLPTNGRSKTNKAGFYSNYGKKPMVRGIAKNPVDHPHGGRTKAIKYQRTPWGKTTKFK
jgi:ribosomal protein L2